MKRPLRNVIGLVSIALLVTGVVPVAWADEPNDRERFEKLLSAGNYKEAYEGLRSLALNARTEPDRVGSDMKKAIECLKQLGQRDEVEPFIEAVVAVHRGNWRLLQAAAESYLHDMDPFGYLVAGRFQNRSVSGAEERVSRLERNRSRAVQLLIQGMERARSDPNRRASGLYFLALAHAFVDYREGSELRRIQGLTPLAVLADYGEDPFSTWNPQPSAAPVEPDGTPLYFRVPESFEKARSDGERWRWALDQAVKVDPDLLNQARSATADFLLRQFDNLTSWDWSAMGGFRDPGPQGSGPFAFEALGDDEMIARLANGVRRFKLPDEFNPIKIYRAIADDRKSALGEKALDALSAIFERRRQFDRAAEYLKRSLDIYGDRADGRKANHLDQILGAWGQIEGPETQPAGRGATFDFRFRNGPRVQFEAHEVLLDKLLKDIKDHIASRPKQLDSYSTYIANIGDRLVERNQLQYLGRAVARWDLDLQPLPGHRDRQITVTTPLQKAGAYFLTARMEGGNTSRVVVWLNDTVIIEKDLADKLYFFVADARTGHPVPRADLELFGWREEPVPGKDESRIETDTFALKTDDEGQLQVPIGDPANRKMQSDEWIITARTAEGRFAYLHLSWSRGRNQGDPDSGRVRFHAITDRPVYRPGATVRFKFWVARDRHNQPDATVFAGKDFSLQINNPRGDTVLTRSFKADAFGGFDGTFEVPSDATLGVYQVLLPNWSGGKFRVEEYKKPEFDVKVEGPTLPAILGETIRATIKANYLFGGPVAAARVRYTIARRPVHEDWYPAGRWDCLFGPGYGWFAADSPWYPGWSRWGMLSPESRRRSRRGRGSAEVVADAELPIRPDGTLPIEIDTTTDRLADPDGDHRYEITAEVTDASRRTVHGTGAVRVGCKPFTVHLAVDRGFYRAGDTIEAVIQAQTLDRKPVAGKGTLELLRVTYDARRRPVETLVEKWDVTLDSAGHARRVLKASTPGQYRLSTTIDDGKGHAIEGGYLLNIIAEGLDNANLRFNDLEIIPERKEYRPGETLRLLINTDRVNSTVLLFVRPAEGVYPPPRVLHLRGQSAIAEIGIVPGDMPNLFVEALTMADGKIQVITREIAVPPESRVLDVAIEPSRRTYNPGRMAKVKIKLAVPVRAQAGDPRPAPLVASVVLAVYDKAVESISGGSNVPDIRESFWNRTRWHQPSHRSKVYFGVDQLLKPNEIDLQELGEFRKDPNDGVEYAGIHIARYASISREYPRHRAELVLPSIRTNFADTAFWAANLTTAPDGTVEVEFPLPESLTTWKVKAWAMGAGTMVGEAETEIVTTKDLLLRLQAPRFFVEKDEVVLSANVHNRLETRKAVQVVLELDGGVLQPMGETSRVVEIASGSQQRVDWRVKVVREGRAVIRMKALTDEESDAAQMSFPAHVHGMLKTESFAGTIRPDQQTAQLVLRVPAERIPDRSRLEVRFSPTLAGALVDALPYLSDYPYGCTEQTLNRFLPTVLTQKVLIELGLDLKAIRDTHTNLDAQQLGDARAAARSWKGYEHNPVFDPAEVTKIASAGLRRLADMQLSDGGWGWFSGTGEHVSAHTTALVVHGLLVARRNDLKPPPGVLERALEWLKSDQARQVEVLASVPSQDKPLKSFADDVDALVFMVLTDADVRNDRMLTFLHRDRTHLSVYAKAMFGLALERLGEKDKLAAGLRNIAQYVVRDDENQTAYLKLPNAAYWWTWYGNEIETDAFYLKLLARTDPKGDLARRLAKYLINNRRHGTYWNSTRDTAYCIEALAEYLTASGEDQPDMTVAIVVDGQKRNDVKITPGNLFRFDNTFAIEGRALASGEHTVSFLKQGKGPLYYNAYLTNFTREDPIARTGLEIKINRHVYRLMKENAPVGRPRREPLANGAVVKSGDMVEVELAIESKNDYEYLVFEDFKAAGFEPVEVQSGYNGNALGAYVEFRDERVAFFARTLARGKHSVSYRLRAEVPGRFHALPARAQAMYAPELRANSDEIQLGVED